MKTTIATFIALLVLATTVQAQGRNRGEDKSPKVGDDAPNFTAKVVGKKDTVELKKLIKKEKKPVVLIFGSST